MRRRFSHVAAAAAATWACAILGLASPARADLLITVDKSTQRMLVEKDGAELFAWPVSTGAPGYDTPSGEFKPFRMEKDHFSKEWDDAPMPNSIFFTMKGHAIHGSSHKSIGRPASHGCVRLEPKNAALLFDLVKQEGMGKTRVVLTGDTPGATAAPQVASRAAPEPRIVAPRYAAPQADPGYDQGLSADDQTGDVPALPTQQRVVGWRDANGRIHYYDRPRVYYAPPRRYRYGDAEPDVPPSGFTFFRR